MTRPVSLRARLILIILPPILTIAVLAGLWQFQNARQTADEVINNALLAAALAVANDAAISGGDALSIRTRDILASTSGGLVYYHVYAPDGVIVAGYATPPVGIPRTGEEATDPTYFTARYLGRDVKGVRLQTQTEIDDFAGLYTTTVWQDSAVHRAFFRDLVIQSLAVSVAILLALAFIVWFGVRVGLHPLTDLETAIARRSSGDLAPIRRPVPQEVTGIVATLNALFGQVSRSMQAQSEFIGNAAHQLRNPIAGLLALAEAVRSAKSHEQAKDRSKDLLDAAQQTAELSQKLLTLERAEAMIRTDTGETFDLRRALQTWIGGDTRPSQRGVKVTMDMPDDPMLVHADKVMIQEAVVNLLDNALAHAGCGLSAIDVSVRDTSDGWLVSFADNGRGMTPEDADRATSRFVQLGDSGGSGLGLSIVRAVAVGHGGRFAIRPGTSGVVAELILPKYVADRRPVSG